MVLDENSLQEYPVNTLFPQSSILVPSFSYYALMSLMLFIKLLSMFMIIVCILSVINLWQQLELTSNLEFDLQDAVD